MNEVHKHAARGSRDAGGGGVGGPSPLDSRSLVKVTDVTLDVVQAQHRALVAAAVLVFPAGAATQLVFNHLGRNEERGLGFFDDLHQFNIISCLRTHNAGAGAWASHLIKVIKELQDGEYAGSDEKSHVSADIA